MPVTVAGTVEMLKREKVQALVKDMMPQKIREAFSTDSCTSSPYNVILCWDQRRADLKELRKGLIEGIIDHVK